MENVLGSTNEFDIPESQQVLPSLESILQEDDSSAYQFEDFIFQNMDDKLDDTDGNISMASIALPVPKPNITDLLKTKHPTLHGSILRHVILRKISSQMIDACVRRDAGMPTSMAVSKLIAVGTSHGLALVFEPKHEVLKLVLGTTNDGAKYGAVTALAINVDCDRLLCGYARGQLTMWDLNKGSCLRVITDAHPTGYAVLHIQFTDDRTIAMLNDSSGSVYTLSFKRALTRTCESTCFFSGSKGEVCTMAPLHMSPNLKDSPLYTSSLLAMSSLTKLIIVNMKPSPVAVFTRKMVGPPDTLPLLGWYFTLVESEPGRKQLVPVLAFGRNSTILFFKVEKAGEDFIFQEYHSIRLNYTMIAMNWLNSQVIVTIDTLERIRTIDILSKEELECLDLASVQLVYGTSYFQSLSTGGNVSEALKTASKKVCYQSVQCFSSQILLLGTKTIHCLTLRTWQDRLEYFIKRNEFLGALKLAELFYLDKGKAVVGLVGNKEIRKKLIAEEIVNILLSYLDVAMTVNCPKTNDDNILAPYFRELVPTSIKYCLLIDDLELLFTDVYERFSDDAVAKKEFLEGLEADILDSKIRSLTPVVMQDLIDHYETTSQIRKIEACFVYLDLATVDIDYLVRLCWSHRLYDLVINVFNKGLHDYLTPLEKLIKILRDAMKVNEVSLMSDEDTKLGCTILVYLSCCLAGNQYPIGRIAKERVKEVKDDIFNSIIIKRSEHTDFNETYPYIRTLLMFDTREFLNVLSFAFEEKEFEPENEAIAVGAPSKRQKVVDVLLQVMVNDQSFSPAQLGVLFTFIARQMAKHEGSIHVNKLLFEQVLEYLANPDEESRHEEREQALLELLSAGGLKQFPDEQVLALSESAKFYRVCEIIYQKKRQYAKMLSCYWRDPTRKTLVFSYINTLLMDDSFTDLEKEEISMAVLDSMGELIMINSMKFAKIVVNHFPSMVNEITLKLNGKPEIQYAFFKGIFEGKRSEISQQEVNTSKTSKFKIDPDVQEKYIELMCLCEPENVLRYLQSTDSYRLEQALAIVQPKKLVHPTAYLLERMGDVLSAFKLLLDELEEKIKELNRCFSELPHEDDVTDELNFVLKSTGASLHFVLQLCQRNSQRMESDDRKSLWFPLLETVMAPQRSIKNTQSRQFLTFKNFRQDVVVNMTSFISLPAVLEKMMQDPSHKSRKFGDMKELILGMLDTYNYELTLHQTTHKLLGKDLHGQYKQQQQYLRKGFQPMKNQCNLCSQKFKVEAASGNAGYSKSDMILFRCGHVYHRSCLQSSVGFEEELLCIHCNKSNVISTVSFRRSNSRTDKNGKTPVRRAAAKKSDFQVNLSDTQVYALNRLWEHGSKNTKMTLLSGLVDKRSNNWSSNNPSKYVDEKFSVRLAPPIVRN